MELDTNEPGVLLEFDNLHTLAEVVLADEVETGILQLLDVLWVHLVTAAVRLIDGSALKSVEDGMVDLLDKIYLRSKYYAYVLIFPQFPEKKSAV